MRLLNVHISKIFIRTVLVMCLMFFGGQIDQVDAQTFTPASIQGEYAFTSMLSCGGVGDTGDAVAQDVAAGIILADASGNATGKINLNIYDFDDVVPFSDRLVLAGFPITGSYTVDADGFGTMTLKIDFDLDTIVDQEIAGKIVITKAKINTVAKEFWFISDEPLEGGALVKVRFENRGIF